MEAQKSDLGGLAAEAAEGLGGIRGITKPNRPFKKMLPLESVYFWTAKLFHGGNWNSPPLPSGAEWRPRRGPSENRYRFQRQPSPKSASTEVVGARPETSAGRRIGIPGRLMRAF
jgi:hypothetical protein